MENSTEPVENLSLRPVVNRTCPHKRYRTTPSFDHVRGKRRFAKTAEYRYLIRFLADEKN